MVPFKIIKSNLMRLLWLLQIEILFGVLLFADIHQPDFAHHNTATLLSNPTPYIVEECYTKTKETNGKVHNPCFACHTDSSPPNYINDADLQLRYSFGETSRKNPWSNHFEDRSARAAAITDQAISEYIRTDNYFDKNGNIALAQRLQEMPPLWDYNENGKWDGYMPDCYFDFDQEGFDRTPKGGYSGWRAFGYTPFLGTFWPTNGSLDDLLIRLPESFRSDEKGEFNTTIYGINLAIVEALIKKRDVPIVATDERLLGVDLDKNGILEQANRIKYEWDPPKNRMMSYVGGAKRLMAEGKVHLAAGLYPEGSEFLHTVRYIDLDDDKTPRLAPRLKELRYSKKLFWATYFDLLNRAQEESKEQTLFPARTRRFFGNFEEGVMNGAGWRYQGFIEDQKGDLRPQNYEETLYCIGCHSGIGATADSSFAFWRKLEGREMNMGWFHWSQRGLKGIKEPKRADGTGEYRHYLLHNGSGDPMRNNQELSKKFFLSSGKLDQSSIAKMEQDISTLLFPSPKRAMQLNKAYKAIVEEQSFIYGRNAPLKPNKNIHKELEEDEQTGIKEPIGYHK